MQRAECDKSLFSPLSISPELPAVKRRALQRICAVVGMTMAVPLVVLVYGYVSYGGANDVLWVRVAAVFFVLASMISFFVVYVIYKGYKKDMVVRIEFAPTFLTLVSRYSRVAIDYHRISGLCLVYLPVGPLYANGEYITHRSMQLILYENQCPDSDTIRNSFDENIAGSLPPLNSIVEAIAKYGIGERLGVINARFPQLNHIAEAIGDRIATISGHQIVLNEKQDRDFRLL